MNTLTKGIAKRAISILLVAIMVLSLGIIGISTASAAEFEIADVGYDGSHTMYCISDKSWENNSTSLMTRDNANSKWWKTFDNVSTSQNFYFAISVLNSDYLYPEDPNKRTVEPGPNSEWNIWDTDANNTSIGFYDKKQATSWEISMKHLKDFSTVSVTIEFYQDNHIRVYIGNCDIASKDYYLPGTFNGWSTSKTKLEADGSNYSQTLSLATGNYEFKLYDSTKKWYGTSSSQIEPQPDPDKSVSVTMDTNEGDNATVIIKTAGDYKFSFNPSTMKITVTFVKAAFEFKLNATADLTTVTQGTPIIITATPNGEVEGATVTYTLKNGSTVIDSNEYGVFDVDTSKLSGDYNYTVEATCTISGVDYSDSASVTFRVNAFTGLSITSLNYTQSVEWGGDITVKASANTSEKVTYVITDTATGETYTSETGNFSIATTIDDKGKTKNFVLTATAEVNGETYKSDEVKFSVEVTDIINTSEINIYFKSTTTYGYAPKAYVQGTKETKNWERMDKHEFIRNNATDTADYWWFVITTEVSNANPNVLFKVKSDRYGMEASIEFTVDEGVKNYYFGVDDLNNGKEMVNLTFEEDKNIRDFCESAVHMVYDPEFDAEETLVAVSSTFARVQNGDVNGDGKVNVRDATLLQKSLANIEELSDVGTKVADVNNDGTITIKDATAIQKQIAGL